MTKQDFRKTIEREFDKPADIDALYDTFRNDILEEAQTWISVKDQLPENNQKVLVLAEYGKMDVCYFNERTEYNMPSFTNWMRPQHSNGSIAYWMPLPAPPSLKTDTSKGE